MPSAATGAGAADMPPACKPNPNKCLYHTRLIPPIFCEYFLCNSQIHSRSTRTQNHIHILALNTSFKKRTVKYRCSVRWNSLFDHMKTWSSVAACKRGSKVFFSLCIAMMIIIWIVIFVDLTWISDEPVFSLRRMLQLFSLFSLCVWGVC